MIPKIIHYCWFGGKEKPESVKRMIDSWKKSCPDFEIKEWNESNYDIDKHPFMRLAKERGKWSFVSDYARLDILYENGGIYLDTDVELLKSLEPLCSYKGFIGFERDDLVNDGQGFGGERGLPVLKEMLAVYDEKSFEYGFVESPILRTEVLSRHGLVKDGKEQTVADMRILPKDYLCPRNYYTGRIEITDNTYGIHYYDGTWKNKKEKRYEGLMRFLCKTFGIKTGHRLFEKLMIFKDRIRGRHV